MNEYKVNIEYYTAYIRGCWPVARIKYIHIRDPCNSPVYACHLLFIIEVKTDNDGLYNGTEMLISEYCCACVLSL